MRSPNPVALLLALACAVAPLRSRADDTATARQLYAEGRAAFDAQDWQRAFGLFRRAFLVSPRPALRYNMAAALERMGKRSDAADELRGYLLAEPGSPQRPALEARIRELDGVQTVERPLQLELLPAALAPAKKPVWKRWWPWTILGVGIGAGVAVGLGVGLSRGVSTTLPATGPGMALRF